MYKIEPILDGKSTVVEKYYVKKIDILGSDYIVYEGTYMECLQFISEKNNTIIDYQILNNPITASCD